MPEKAQHFSHSIPPQGRVPPPVPAVHPPTGVIASTGQSPVGGWGGAGVEEETRWPGGAHANWHDLVGPRMGGVLGGLACVHTCGTATPAKQHPCVCVCVCVRARACVCGTVGR